MADERKKVARTPIIKPEPKKRVESKPIEKPSVKKKVEVKPEIKEEELVNPEIVSSEKKTRVKTSDDKYIKFASSKYSENQKIISERIQKGEIKFAYFAIDGDDFYHYYILIKK